MITLKPMTEQDIPLVISFLAGTDEEFMHMWGGGRWYTYPVTSEQMVRQFHTRTENTRYYIIYNEDEPIGSVELDFIRWDERTCRVCQLIISVQHRGKGYGTDALKILTGHAFQNLGMKCVGLSVYDFNTRAIKCYEKAGFTEIRRITRDNGWVAISMERTKSET
jgi:RimJ/RimL family protein N-acetyltransferase